jgi:hypothetical protein
MYASGCHARIVVLANTDFTRALFFKLNLLYAKEYETIRDGVVTFFV